MKIKILGALHCELLNNVRLFSFLIMFFILFKDAMSFNTLTIGHKCLLNDILLQKKLQKML